MSENGEKRLKVLVSAYACEPGKGSEPGVGWNWVRQIARFHDVWVLTRESNRKLIEDDQRENPWPNVQWIYYDTPQWTRFWKRGTRGVQIYYYMWQIGIYRLAKRLHTQEKFDIVHHITFGNYWLPSFLPYLDAPFVWGPVGGGENAPASFHKTFSFRNRVFERVRDVIRGIAHINPFVRMNARRSRIALVKANETGDSLRKLGAKHVEQVFEAGIHPHEYDSLSQLNIREDGALRLVSIGRMLHWKGFHLGLMAFAEFCKQSPDSEYWLIGGGREKDNLRELVKSLGIADKVQFLGSIPRSEVLERLQECDVLVHPSLHDSGGWVCMEAMAAGRPVLCLNLGGPAVQVTPEVGITVEANTPEQAVQDLAAAMQQLQQEPQTRMAMAQAARQRIVNYFMWDRKGEYITRTYQTSLKS